MIFAGTIFSQSTFAVKTNKYFDKALEKTIKEISTILLKKSISNLNKNSKDALKEIINALFTENYAKLKKAIPKFVFNIVKVHAAKYYNKLETDIKALLDKLRNGKYLTKKEMKKFTKETLRKAIDKGIDKLTAKLTNDGQEQKYELHYIKFLIQELKELAIEIVFDSKELKKDDVMKVVSLTLKGLDEGLKDLNVEIGIGCSFNNVGGLGNKYVNIANPKYNTNYLVVDRITIKFPWWDLGNYKIFTRKDKNEPFRLHSSYRWGVLNHIWFENFLSGILVKLYDTETDYPIDSRIALDLVYYERAWKNNALSYLKAGFYYSPFYLCLGSTDKPVGTISEIPFGIYTKIKLWDIGIRGFFEVRNSSSFKKHIENTNKSIKGDWAFNYGFSVEVLDIDDFVDIFSD